MKSTKNIKVYGTLVNGTLDTSVSDNDHNDVLMNAYQLYDGRFGATPASANFLDVINKRLTGITYADGDTTITGDLIVTGSIIGGDLGAHNLSELRDVNIAGIGANKYLKYDGTKWIPSLISLVDISEFDGLNGAVEGQVLKYRNGKWRPSADLVGENPITTINGLDDVDTTGATNGSVLKYNGTTWVVGADNTGNNGATTLDGLNDVDTTGASTGSILKYNGTSWVVGTDNTGNNGATNLNGLSDVDTTGATNGSILKYNGSLWVVGTDIEGVTGAADLNGLSSVAVSSPQNGQVLYYDSISSKWVNRKLSLSDITMPNASEGQVLKYTSGAWIAATDNTSSGSSGGVTLNQPLSAINSANLGEPSQSNVGLVWNGSAWTYQSLSSDSSNSGTQSGTITIGGVEAVDLGLSVKWATHNIGATNLSDTGYGFEWGNKNPFTTPSPHKRFGTNINPLTEQPYDSDMSGEDIYNQSLNNGFLSTTYLSAIGKFSSENDMATQTLGNGWFTPTYEHFTELVRNTTVQVYYLLSENKWVLKFTARNGNYIIMPFCGKFWVNEVLEQQNFLYHSPQTLTTDTAPCINLETAFLLFYQSTDPYGLTYNSNNGNHVPSETLSQRKMILSWMDNAWGLSFAPYDHVNDPNYVGSTDYKYNIYPVRAVHL